MGVICCPSTLRGRGGGLRATAGGSTSRQAGVGARELLDRLISGGHRGGQVCGQTFAFQFSRSEIIFCFRHVPRIWELISDTALAAT